MEPPNKRAKLYDHADGDCDVVVEGIHVRVHSLLLRLASPVFAALFQNQMKENSSGIVELPGKAKAEFDLFIKFLQPGSRERIDEGNVDIMLPWFDEYQVMVLKDECETFLLSTPPTTARLLQADRHNLQKQKARCMRFVTPSEFVRNFEELFSAPRMCREILEFIKPNNPKMLNVAALIEKSLDHEASHVHTCPVLNVCVKNMDLVDDELRDELLGFMPASAETLQVMSTLLARYMRVRSQDQLVAFKQEVYQKLTLHASALYQNLTAHRALHGQPSDSWAQASTLDLRDRLDLLPS